MQPLVGEAVEQLRSEIGAFIRRQGHRVGQDLAGFIGHDEIVTRAARVPKRTSRVVRWAVEIFNQKDELVATYDLLTENVP